MISSTLIAFLLFSWDAFVKALNKVSVANSWAGKRAVGDYF